MPTRGSYLQASLDMFLPFYLIEIDGIAQLFRENLLQINHCGLNLSVPIEKIHDLEQVLDGEHLDSLDYSGLFCVPLGDDNPAKA